MNVKVVGVTVTVTMNVNVLAAQRRGRRTLNFKAALVAKAAQRSLAVKQMLVANFGSWRRSGSWLGRGIEMLWQRSGAGIEAT